MYARSAVCHVSPWALACNSVVNFHSLLWVAVGPDVAAASYGAVVCGHRCVPFTLCGFGVADGTCRDVLSLLRCDVC
jgi:hypothetical protein